MPTYIVTYDLNKEVRRPNIVGEVKKTRWAKLSESSYAIITAETPTQVHRRFAKHLDKNDAFFVISLSRPWTGYGLTASVRFLTATLGPGELHAQHTASVPPPPLPYTVPNGIGRPRRK